MLDRVRYSEPYRGIHVEAFTDGYAYDDYEQIYLLSAAGRESSVKAVTSAVTSGASVDILSRSTVSVTKPYGETYRILSSKLPSGHLHQLVLSEGFLDPEPHHTRLIYVPDGQEPAEIVYDAVRAEYPVPLIPQRSCGSVTSCPRAAGQHDGAQA